jgi:hypothetical protein
MNNYGGDVGLVPAHWVFNAIEGSPAKGTVSYSDTYGGSYSGVVTSVTVDPNGKDATFTASLSTAWRGSWSATRCGPAGPNL